MKAVVIEAPHQLTVRRFFDEPGPLAPGHVRVRMAAGGICGSDLHYYHHGGFGVVRIREPMALGHEAAGHVEAVGEGVAGLAAGDLVAVNPSAPCGHCGWCQRGVRVHCENMRFNGSAMRFPHVQGLFRERIDVEAARAVPLPAGVAPELAALCEPLAVCLHAIAQAGDLAGRTVLVSGSGPIGALTIAAARHAGAARVVATDITPHCLAMAERMGAHERLDLSGGPGPLQPFAEGRGRIDVAFECSGSPAALAGVVSVMRPRGRVVLVGLGGDAPVSVNAIVTKELTVSGTFRFDDEFGEAARLIGSGAVDLSPALSATYPIDEAVAAFEHAGDRNRATKVAIRLS